MLLLGGIRANGVLMRWLLRLWLLLLSWCLKRLSSLCGLVPDCTNTRDCFLLGLDDCVPEGIQGRSDNRTGRHRP